MLCELFIKNIKKATSSFANFGGLIDFLDQFSTVMPIHGVGTS
jgi:hypothetical protein